LPYYSNLKKAMAHTYNLVGMSEIIKEVNCPHCGAPLKFDKGDIIFTCGYCGFTGLFDLSKSFTYEHGMFINQVDVDEVDKIVIDWFAEGFLKPPDLRKKGKIFEKKLVYVPLWIISLDATTSYEGFFERLGPTTPKKNQLKKSYDWVIIARKNAPFPEREYHLGLASKSPFDVSRLERYSTVLNSEIDAEEAVDRTIEEVKSLHQYLALRDVDKILAINTEVKILERNYLHAPIWFVTYEYKGKLFKIYLDGAREEVIVGEFPET